MVERSLSMREVPGSIPGFSNATFFTFVSFFLFFFFPASVFRIVVCLLKTGFLGGRVSLLHTLQEMILSVTLLRLLAKTGDFQLKPYFQSGFALCML